MRRDTRRTEQTRHGRRRPAATRARRRETETGAGEAAPGYPSLREHLAAHRAALGWDPRTTSRRRFLGLAGASLAASGLAAACGRALGEAGETPDAGPDAGPDARPHEPDATIEIGGVVPEPGYYTVRIPTSGELSAYLVDGGYLSGYVTAVTWDPTSYQNLMDSPDLARDRVRSILEDYTYDTLSTADGVSAAEDGILEALDELCQELGGHTSPTIQSAALTVVNLSPDAPLMGSDGGTPEYP